MYKKFRHEIKPWHSEDYLEWFHKKFPDRDPHHLLGSIGPLKLTDSLIIPVMRIEHSIIHEDPEEEFNRSIVFSINIFQEYVTHLKSENEFLTAITKRILCGNNK